MKGNGPAADRRRFARLQAGLLPQKLDALLFFDMKNIRYLTGFTGSDGVLLVRGDRAQLLVDGRYTTQAGEQAPHCEVIRYRDKIGGIAAALAEGEVSRVGFEAAALTVELYEKLRDKVESAELLPFTGEAASLRSIKDEEELSAIRRAVEVATVAIRDVLPLLKPGREERDIALEIDYQMRRRGAEENAFPTIVASGLNAALPHARPGQRKLAAGDPVIMDYGAVADGYRSDETCTFILGRAEGEFRKAYEIVKEAHDRALDAVKAGVPCREIDRIARQCIEAKGYGLHFSHGTGHGVGLDVHEAPRLSPLSEEILAAGMVITVEPGIYLPGRWGIRIEDMAVVREDGAEVLTEMSKEMKIIEI